MREMKDSGVAWIGNIPTDWNCCKQKYALRLINGRAYSEDEFEVDGKYRILRVGNLFSNPTWYTSSLELPSDKYCENGDLLYAWSMSYAPIIWEGEKVIYHYHIWKVALSERINKKYAFYYLTSLTDAMKAEVHETTMGFLTMKAMNNSFVVLPPLNIQDSITRVLDKKCSQVDALIANVQAQIEKLKAYKQSVITEVVTKGLDPTVPMKDSGVDWMGSIPAVWYPIRLKYLLSVKSGNAIRNELLSDEGLVPVYGGGEMIGYTSEANVPVGSILIGRVGARCGCITLPDGIAYATDNALVVNTNVNRKYLYYLLVACNLNRLNTSNAQPLITGGKIREAAVPFTTVDSEQAAIVDFLDHKAAIIDKLITLKQFKIEKLEQYKKSLIYEYVTGKKEA